MDRLPTEFLRKGRFDEIFSVALPTPQERLQIIKIHLKKRKLYNAALDLSTVIQKTDGFSGADLEAGIACAVEEYFIRRIRENTIRLNTHTLSSEDLLHAFTEITPLSSALREKFEKMKEKLKEYNVRPAYSERETILVPSPKRKYPARHGTQPGRTPILNESASAANIHSPLQTSVDAVLRAATLTMLAAATVNE